MFTSHNGSDGFFAVLSLSIFSRQEILVGGELQGGTQYCSSQQVPIM